MRRCMKIQETWGPSPSRVRLASLLLQAAPPAGMSSHTKNTAFVELLYTRWLERDMRGRFRRVPATEETARKLQAISELCLAFCPKQNWFQRRNASGIETRTYGRNDEACAAMRMQPVTDGHIGHRTDLFPPAM